MEKVRKHSKKRDAILNCIRSTRCPPTADWVYQQLKPEIPDLSLGTVYRNLAMFREEGMIQSLGTVNGMERYDGNTEPHTHFVCAKCSQVIDLETVELPEPLVYSAAEAAGGTIAAYQLLFNGTCHGCREKRN